MGIKKFFSPRIEIVYIYRYKYIRMSCLPPNANFAYYEPKMWVHFQVERDSVREVGISYLPVGVEVQLYGGPLAEFSV